MRSRYTKAVLAGFGVVAFVASMSVSIGALAATTAVEPHCIWDLGTTCRSVNCIDFDGVCLGQGEECHCRLPEAK